MITEDYQMIALGYQRLPKITKGLPEINLVYLRLL